MDAVEIYTDGACLGNTKANTRDSYGGWGVLLKYRDKEKTYSGGYRGTSNNQMEIQAVIEALSSLTRYDLPIVVYTDSNYVINGVTTWIKNWEKNGWLTEQGNEVKNIDFWKELDHYVKRCKDIKFVKVPGHAGVEGNEVADRLATQGAEQCRRRCMKDGEKEKG
jgi:ribonuclease HI